MAWHPDPLVERAREIYIREHQRKGTPESAIVFPAPADSTHVGDLIELRFGTELLAAFRVRSPVRRLRRLVVERDRLQAAAVGVGDQAEAAGDEREEGSTP